MAAWQPQHAPGTVREYSNPSIALLGLVAARALGRDFAEAVEAELFLRLGMRASHLHLPPAALATQQGRFVAGNLLQGLVWEQDPWPVSREWLLGGNAAEMIFEPVRVLPARAAATSGPRLFNKTGSTAGFGAYVAFVPEKQVAVVLLANRNFPIAARVEAGWAILRSLAPEPR